MKLLRAAAALLMSCVVPALASAQEAKPTVAPLVAPAVDEAREGADSGVKQVGCTNCGSLPAVAPIGGPGIFGYGLHGAPPSCGAAGCGDSGCGGGCGEGGCAAGYPSCDSGCEGTNRLHRMFMAFHNALACPDPCYEPTWVDPANASLFTPSARTGTYTRLRWDNGQDVTTPDRSEFFWAAIKTKGPAKPETRVNYNELSLYAEVGTSRFSFFVDTPYRSLDGAVNGGAGAFGDISLGTKAMLLDSELLQYTFQFKTTLPSGNASDGTGTGHVSLEPSLIWTMKLFPELYWQSQLAYWIPIGATPGFSGGVLEYNNSLNMVLCRPLKDTAFMGTIETSGYTFTAGSFTDPTTGMKLSGNNTTYFGIGPGFRLAIANKIDFGFGVEFAATQDHFAQQLYRTEFRWRF
jgi:hypothetical protein